MHSTLVALVFSVWAAMPFPWNEASKSSDATRVADAIAYAVESESEPAEGESPAMDLALLAYYAAKESGAHEHPIATSWDAKAGLSLGVWQMRSYLVNGHSLRWQASTWLDAVHRAGVVGADSSPYRARLRTDAARDALRVALNLK